MGSLFWAKVKYPCREPRETSNGQLRINAVLVLDNGEETKLWGDPDDPISQLKKGSRVQLFHDGKNYKVAEFNPKLTASVPASVAASVAADGEDIKEVAVIYQELQELLPEGTSEGAIVNLVQSIFKYRHS